VVAVNASATVEAVRFAASGSTVNASDAVTADVTDVLTLHHTTSGAAAAGFGTGFVLTAESSTGTSRQQGAIQSEFVVATDASFTSRLSLSVTDFNGDREGIRVEADGSAPKIGFLGTAAAAQQAHVADPSGGGTVDAEARTAINSILSTLEAFGFHATS
jgi:hypothetical protein